MTTYTLTDDEERLYRSEDPDDGLTLLSSLLDRYPEGVEVMSQCGNVVYQGAPTGTRCWECDEPFPSTVEAAGKWVICEHVYCGECHRAHCPRCQEK